MSRAELGRARRIVVKVGTSLLADPAGGIKARRFASLANEIADLRSRGVETILVSSGAIGLGVRKLGLADRPRAIPQKQAAAAIGQIDLCRRFERAFARHDLMVGQILLTHQGLADREGFLNARHTLHALLEAGVVPLINENDSVATEELRFSDNDQLSAMVINLSAADLLILLTDTDGLHDRDPEAPGARRIEEVQEVDQEILGLAAARGSVAGTGGMRAKLEAAGSAARQGVATVIADGRRPGMIARILAGESVGTLVLSGGQRLSSRKHWIAYSLTPRGTLQVDDGAVRAVRERGRSLLAVGITAFQGQFGRGDAVRCVSPAGEEIARGLISYDARELGLICGQRADRISVLLGYSHGDEVIHRDDLVLLSESPGGSRGE
jgi:glutamate 5-kinase